MNYPEKLDLHMHSTVSDGTDSPAELLDRVREAGLGLFALTDHDAMKGCLSIADLHRESDPAFLTGVEFSCRDEEGRYHILGYGYDPQAEPIRQVVQSGHSIRIKKVLSRLEHLKTEFGFSFPEKETERLLALENPGKPHIANLMVRLGYAETKEQAFRDYLNRLHIRGGNVRPEEAIRGIRDSGGIPVLAHPSFGNGDDLILGDEMEQRLRRLIPFGLQGVEAFYSGFSPRMRDELLGFAERFDLYVTAGSDYHGKNKLVALGDTGLEPDLEMPAGLKRFLDAVEDRLY